MNGRGQREGKTNRRGLERLIFDQSAPGRRGIFPPAPDVEEINPEDCIPSSLLRKDIEGFPEVSELDLVRHYTRLSKMNIGIESAFYPLGSCTMKYNPRINEDIASFEGFTSLHPYQPVELTQGALHLIYQMERYLAEISGMDAVSLHPAAGAQGELIGMLIVAAYLRDKGGVRRKIIIPDTAHGTNPASCRLAGFKVATVKANRDGVITPDDIYSIMDEDTAAIMLTNPNTLGLFERHIKEISDIIHSKGGLVYLDGANLNAVLGVARPGDSGVDIMHFNLHKTFSTPHGGGGPGSGPVGVKKMLEPYLPSPRICKEGRWYALDYDNPKSVKRLRAFYTNFGIVVRAYSYLRAMGPEGLKKAARMAVLNANYIMTSLKEFYHLPYNHRCMHECVFSDGFQSENRIHAVDIAKRLMDYGFHPPTIYFPLIVKGAIMIEPTETEGKETIDSFIDAMKKIAIEAREDDNLLRTAPHTTVIGRLDEVKAVRKPVLRWKKALDQF